MAGAVEVPPCRALGAVGDLPCPALEVVGDRPSRLALAVEAEGEDRLLLTALGVEAEALNPLEEHTDIAIVLACNELSVHQ